MYYDIKSLFHFQNKINVIIVSRCDKIAYRTNIGYVGLVSSKDTRCLGNENPHVSVPFHICSAIPTDALGRRMSETGMTGKNNISYQILQE